MSENILSNEPEFGQPSATPHQGAPAVQSKGLAIATLVTGLLSLVLLLVFLFTSVGELPFIFAVVFGIASVVLGIIALRRKQPKSLALTGLIVGALSALIALSLFVFALIFVGAIMGQLL